MTDEERKQFINEYCRNVAHKPMTKLCNTCEYLRYCARSGIEEVGCDRYKRDTTTNEEWFCGLSTEEKAEFSMRVFKNCTWCLDGGSPKECPFNEFLDCPAESKENMIKWLKEVHDG